RLPFEFVRIPRQNGEERERRESAMSEIAHIAAAIFKRAGKERRLVVAIAGPPGAGKSTLSAALHGLLPEGSAEVVAMDGFHFDDAILDRRGLRARKGAPETFDFT